MINDDIQERMKFMHEYQQSMLEYKDKMIKEYNKKSETFESYSNKQGE